MKDLNPIDYAVYGMLVERSAQVGEPWTMDMQRQMMEESAEVYDEYKVQCECVIKAFEKAQLKNQLEFVDDWPIDDQAIKSNQWNKNLSQFIKYIEVAGAFWCEDWNLKYLNIRVDTRDGAFIIYDENGKGRIKPDRIIKAIKKWNNIK